MKFWTSGFRASLSSSARDMHMLIHEAGSEVQSFRLNDFQIWKTNLRQVVFNSSNFFFQNKDVLFFLEI